MKYDTSHSKAFLVFEKWIFQQFIQKTFRAGKGVLEIKKPLLKVGPRSIICAGSMNAIELIANEGPKKVLIQRSIPLNHAPIFARQTDKASQLLEIIFFKVQIESCRKKCHLHLLFSFGSQKNISTHRNLSKHHRCSLKNRIACRRTKFLELVSKHPGSWRERQQFLGVHYEYFHAKLLGLEWVCVGWI